MLGETWSASVPEDIGGMFDRLSTDTIQVGFRPADVEILANGKTGFHGVVYSFEPLGTKSVLTIDSVGGQRVRALVDGHRTFQVDRRINFSVSTRSLIFFDRDSARYIARSSQTEEEYSHHG
jgi:ABC-type sugar transport system ATPase subunit